MENMKKEVPQRAEKGDHPSISGNTDEMVQEVLRIFSFMDTHDQLDSSNVEDRYPMFKEPGLLKPLPHGVIVSDGSED